MVRYKNDLSKQNSVLQFRTNRKLETKTQTKRNLRLNSNLKRKIVIYRENNKFYIDHFAAYALKLTNVRTVMLDNPQLFELSLEDLYKIQKDENIEIEFHDLKKKNIDREKEDSDLSKTLEELEECEYGIGAHGIDTGSIEQKENTAKNIVSEGLNINNNSKTILSTSISLGINDDIEQLTQNLTEYKFGNGKKMTVVIAVPLYIQNNDGEKIFLGFPEENRKTAGQQYAEHCILDQVCGNLKKVPPEFILGYIYKKEDGSDGFIKNEGHYSNINQEKKQELYESISQNINQFSKDINSLISAGNISKLENIMDRMQKLNFPTYLVANAIELAQRVKENEIIKEEVESKVDLTQNSTQGGHTRRIRTVSEVEPKADQTSNSIQSGHTRKIRTVSEVEQKVDPIQNSIQSGNTRRIRDMSEVEPKADSTQNQIQSGHIREILLNSYSDVKISDINTAKGVLGKEIRDPENTKDDMRRE